MNKIRKITAFAAAICLSAVMFTGCGSSGSDEIKEKDIEKAAAQLDGEKRDGASGAETVKEVDPFEKIKVSFEGESQAARTLRWSMQRILLITKKNTI